MIKSITITSYMSEVLKIALDDPYDTGIYIKDIDGLGLPPLNIDYVKSYVGYSYYAHNETQIQPRNITITFGITEGNRSVEDSRKELCKYFYINGFTTLTLESENGSVYVYGYVESLSPNIFSKEETVQVSLLCLDPFFYTGNMIEQVGSNISPRFEIAPTDYYKGWFEEPLFKPLSIVTDYISLTFFSRYSNLKTFMIVIKCYDEWFDGLVLKYPGGKITINKKSKIFNYWSDYRNNGFRYNAEILIINDNNDQGVYENVTNSILNYTRIEEEFPKLKTGYNEFELTFFGCFMEEKDYALIFNHSSGNIIINSYSYGVWFFSLSSSWKRDALEIVISDSVTEDKLAYFLITIGDDVNLPDNIVKYEESYISWATGRDAHARLLPTWKYGVTCEEVSSSTTGKNIFYENEKYYRFNFYTSGPDYPDDLKNGYILNVSLQQTWVNNLFERLASNLPVDGPIVSPPSYPNLKFSFFILANVMEPYNSLF